MRRVTTLCLLALGLAPYSGRTQDGAGCPLSLTLSPPDKTVQVGLGFALAAHFAVEGSGPMTFVRPRCTGSASLTWKVTEVGTGRDVPQVGEWCDYAPPPGPGASFEMWGGDVLKIGYAITMNSPREPGTYEVVATYLNEPTRTTERWNNIPLGEMADLLLPAQRAAAQGEMERMEGSTPCRIVSAPVVITVEAQD